MLVNINGSETEIPAECTIRYLLEIRNLAVAKVVVELNGDIIKSGQWENTKLDVGDRLEIIRFVGGG